jgi:hypothetical protein
MMTPEPVRSRWRRERICAHARNRISVVQPIAWSLYRLSYYESSNIYVSWYLCIYVYMLVMVSSFLLTLCRQIVRTVTSNKPRRLHPHPFQFIVQTHLPIRRHLITLRNRIVLEKLIIVQLVKKFPTFYEIQGYFSMFTAAQQWTL